MLFGKTLKVFIYRMKMNKEKKIVNIMFDCTKKMSTKIFVLGLGIE